MVVMDETVEARKALRFASQRAARTGGAIHILALVPQNNFNAFGGVQATIEQEAKDRAEVLANSEAGNIYAEHGKRPTIAVKTGDPQASVKKYLEEHGNISALVLGSHAESGPGPLVAHFSSSAASLPCPLYIVPGGLTTEQIDAIA